MPAGAGMGMAALLAPDRPRLLGLLAGLGRTRLWVRRQALRTRVANLLRTETQRGRGRVTGWAADWGTRAQRRRRRRRRAAGVRTASRAQPRAAACASAVQHRL